MFLLFFVLDTGEIVYYLFIDTSEDFIEIQEIIGEIGPYDRNNNWKKNIDNSALP